MNDDSRDSPPPASPEARNRQPGEAVPGGPGYPVVARLRSALDELTAGAEPNGTRVTALAARRSRRWMLPAVAAAAVAVVVGVAIAVVGRDGGGTPAAPTPTGPPVTPVPVRASPIPWYELRLDDGTTGSEPANLGLGVTAGQSTHVWASPDYAHVLVATAATRPDASTQPDDWPIIEPIADPPSGVAWSFGTDDPNAVWHGIYWAPDDETAVVVTGFGFSAADLAEVLPALHLERDGGTPTVMSALSSLVPLNYGTGRQFLSVYSLPDAADPTAVAMLSVTDGPAVPLAMYSSAATAITTVTTPFGDGFRMDTPGQPRIWWQIDGGPYWGGLSAPADQIDELLARVTRVDDISVPVPAQPPDGGPVTTAPWPAGTSPGPSIPTAANEPAMTALMPSLPGGDGQPPIAVGESVMLSAAKSLGTAGITVYADEASQARDIAAELERLRDIDAFGDVVIIQVGTNGTVTEADLDRIMAAVADVERVVVLTVHADRLWIGPNNELIRALPDRYPNVVVLDWDAIASTCGDCLTADGIHVEDRRLYAGAIADAAGLD